jgi:ABC-2 type transport system permease protein
MAGGFLALGSCVSALSKNQIVAFILSLVLCFVLVVSGFPIVQDVFSGWAPLWVIDALSSMSFLTHFNAISRGVIDLRDVVYFLAMIGTWLYATVIVIDIKKAD